VLNRAKHVFRKYFLGSSRRISVSRLHQHRWVPGSGQSLHLFCKWRQPLLIIIKEI